MRAQEFITVEAVDDKFVIITRTEVRHRVRLPAGDPWLWSARCSWAFGRTLTEKHDELCDYRERKVLEQNSCT